MLRKIALTMCLLMTMMVSFAGDMVNINTASQDELITLAGIGESKAAAIIAYREAYGPFPSISALIQVKGVGESILEKNREIITVDN